MPWLPYHHDWRLAYQTALGVRVHWFGRYAGTPDWKIEPSRLAADMISFFFVERNACWAIVNGRRHALRSGDLLIIRGGDEFSFGHNPKRPHVSLSASLALEQGSMANALLCRKFHRRYSLQQPSRYVAEFEKVLAAIARTTPARDLEIGGALLQWLAWLMNDLKPAMDRTFADDRSVVDKILVAETWADARLAKVITLTDWARAVGLKPVYFGRIFKRETGLRPMDWLNQRRLQLACQQLASTSKTITEIAEATGFASPFYFSRVFRKHFDQSPLQYRKQVSA